MSKIEELDMPPGDSKDVFDSATDQITKYQGLLSKAAGGGAQ